MRRLWLVLTLCAVGAAPAFPADEAAAQEKAASAEPEKSEPFKIRRIEFGLQNPEVDTASSRFREYRSLASGLILPSLHFAGNDGFRYDVRATDVLQDDAYYRARFEPGAFDIRVDYRKIPHRFGNDGRTLYTERPDSVFLISDTLQRADQSALESQFAVNKAGVNFAFLQALVNPSIDAASRVDLALSRDRGRFELGWKPDGKPLDLKVSYFQERRHGNRAAGTSFGFSNVVESAEPIEYRTHDFTTAAEWTTKWGLVRGGVRYNWFENAHLTQTFDNPFRVTDSTDASAYQSPGSGSIGGPAVGVTSLPPENQALTGSAGFVVKLPSRTRVTADAALSRWTQDSPFMPFTSNTAVRLPDGRAATDPGTLPAQSLDGKIDVQSFSLNVVSRPAAKLFLTARYRRYDMDNQTPRVSFEEGYTRFDAVWEDIPRISVPYGYATDRAQATASYDFGAFDLEGGYRLNKTERTYREVEETSEGVVFGAVRVQPWSWALLRVSAEQGKRDFDGEYDPEHAEDASFLEPGPLTNQPILRRYDLAKKDSHRLLGQLQLTPGGNTTIALSYQNAQDDYDESPMGLVEGKIRGYSADIDYTPSERWGVYAFASRETFDSLQRGRQSAATPSTNPLDDWTSAVKDEVDTFGGGLNLVLVKDKLDVHLNGTYQRVNGNNDFDSPPGGTPDVAFDIAEFDDTKTLMLGGELGYKASKMIRVMVGGWFEDYTLRDSATSAIATYLPGSIFLAANDGDYRAHVVYVRAAYVW